MIAALDQEIAQMEQVRSLLAGKPPTDTPRKTGRPKSATSNPGSKASATKSGMSAEVRARISAAQKARWARAAR